MVTIIEINGQTYTIMVGQGGLSWWQENENGEPTIWGDTLMGVCTNPQTEGDQREVLQS